MPNFKSRNRVNNTTSFF